MDDRYIVYFQYKYLLLRIHTHMINTKILMCDFFNENFKIKILRFQYFFNKNLEINIFMYFIYLYSLILNYIDI